MEILTYDRAKAVAYAERWALSRNPRYYDFENIGGDCTNFASQCIYAGAGVMNWTPVTGWYYIDAARRTASWTGVEYLYRFLVTNGGAGPFARLVMPEEVQPGDIVQLGPWSWASAGEKSMLLPTPTTPCGGPCPATNSIGSGTCTLRACGNKSLANRRRG